MVFLIRKHSNKKQNITKKTELLEKKKTLREKIVFFFEVYAVLQYHVSLRRYNVICYPSCLSFRILYVSKYKRRNELNKSVKKLV